MNNIDEFRKNIRDKKIAVLGAGISNIPAIIFLVENGAKVSVFDKDINLKDKHNELDKDSIEYYLGQDCMQKFGKCDKFDYIFRSPGVKPFLPEIVNSVKKGAILTSEIELVIALSPCKVIGVTGSDGKTTTTTLVAKFLEMAGYKVWLGGNIGIPLFSKLEQMAKDDVVVLELSSFQLMTLHDEVDIAVITNIAPNHLDYHRSFEEYIDAKANIFKYQPVGKSLILNADNMYTKNYIEQLGVNREKDLRQFSLVSKVNNGTYIDEGKIVTCFDGKIDFIEDIYKVKLVGLHNIANICCAISAVYDMVKKEDIISVITSFGGVEHRMELVRVLNGVRWYNDSIGTSPSRTIAGLISMNKKIIHIAGGYDKNIPYDELGKYELDNVKLLILLGKTAPKIEKSVNNEIEKRKSEGKYNEQIEIINCTSMEEAVKIANDKAVKEDIIVMSPASASFDLYKNFEERGDHFKRLVNELN